MRPVRLLLLTSVLIVSSHGQEFTLSKNGVGPIVMETHVEIQGSVAEFSGSARNDSGVTIQRAEWCVRAKGQAVCAFKLWTTAPFSPGETLTWKTNAKVSKGLPAHEVSLTTLEREPAPDARMTNQDVIRLVEAKMEPEVIIAKIKVTSANFDTSVPALEALKAGGATAGVLLAILDKPRAVAPLSVSAATVSLREVKNIFVERMPNNLDSYIKAEFSKQMKGRVRLVLNSEDADAVLVGVGEENDTTTAQVMGRYLGLRDTAAGAISLLDAGGRVVLWSAEAGDRSLWWGALARGGGRKVAQRLVGSLKAVMER